MSIILLIIDKESCFTTLAQFIFVHLVRFLITVFSFESFAKCIKFHKCYITFVSIAIKAELGRVNQLPSDIAD